MTRDFFCFALANDVVSINAFYRKEEHLLTLINENNKSWIDYFIIKRKDVDSHKNYKVTPGECLTTQSMILVLDA